MQNKFEETSYGAHEGWYDRQYPDEASRLKNIQTWKDGIANNSINYWLNKRMFAMADPFIKTNETWLTIGNGYGFDALYFKEKNCEVMATDIADTFLPLAKQEGLISDYSVENVEKLSFADDAFDYSYCKESYHHFPRAYMGVYEMLRVSKKAVILIEPQDPLTKMPLMLFLKNILDRFNPNLLQKYWKNRYSFEPVGNYVFKLSDRDMEKLAMGMNLPAIAFKGLNSSYYNPKTANEKADGNSAAFRQIQSKIKKDNFIAKLGILPYQTLCAVIFKTLPDANTIEQMKNDDFLYYEFPKNPYL
jgi:ubiquinone/menaquinone biosynthesis C-methylase UbiE